MKITVSLNVVNVQGQFPSIVFDLVKGASYVKDDDTLVIFDYDNNKRGVVPWSQVLYVLYDDYPNQSLSRGTDTAGDSEGLPTGVTPEMVAKAQQAGTNDQYVVPAMPVTAFADNSTVNSRKRAARKPRAKKDTGGGLAAAPVETKSTAKRTRVLKNKARAKKQTETLANGPLA